MEFTTFGEDILSFLPDVLISLLVLCVILYIAYRLKYYHEVMLGLCGIAVIGLVMLFTGTFPISPKSHDVIAKMVKEDRDLYNSIYKKVNDGLYISMNDQELLFSSWEHVYKKNNTE